MFVRDVFFSVNKYYYLKVKKRYRRNKQLGRTLIVLDTIIAVATAFNVFELHNLKVKLLLLIIMIVLLFLALLEFVTPFAFVSANYVNIYESPLYMTRILKSHIRKVKSSKGRFVVIYCKTWRRKVVHLKSLHVKDKSRFIRELQNIAKRNGIF